MAERGECKAGVMGQLQALLQAHAGLDGLPCDRGGEERGQQEAGQTRQKQLQEEKREDNRRQKQLQDLLWPQGNTIVQPSTPPAYVPKRGGSSSRGELMQRYGLHMACANSYNDCCAKAYKDPYYNSLS
jgi:hypothetical protein